VACVGGIGRVCGLLVAVGRGCGGGCGGVGGCRVWRLGEWGFLVEGSGGGGVRCGALVEAGGVRAGGGGWGGGWWGGGMVGVWELGVGGGRDVFVCGGWGRVIAVAGLCGEGVGGVFVV